MLTNVLKQITSKCSVSKLYCVASFGLSTLGNTQPHVCIVGSGPAGFGVAQTLLKNHEQVQVDMFEKLPVPFGLIRYGVSPDHQDVKNAINGYSQTATSKRFSFFGNIEIGQDVSLTELLSAYHAVVLCYGAQEEATFNISGKNLKNVFSSKQFVGWYNGNPEFQNLDVNLSGKSAVIIGVGNVALDCARMLLKPTEQLQETDITSRALKTLQKSNIKNVYVVGRRGPMQMACTRKELSEVAGLECVNTFVEENCFSKSVETALKSKDLARRKQRRLVAYLQKVSKQVKDDTSEDTKKLYLKLLRSPVALESKNDDLIANVKLIKREMQGEDAFNPTFTDTNVVENLPCDIVVSCIGYQNAVISDDIPFVDGKIMNKNGKVDDRKDLFTCGWCSHGAKGVLADSSNDSLVTGASVLSNLDQLASDKNCNGSNDIVPKILQRGLQITSWKDWKTIDSFEIKRGQKLGKVREKVVSCDEMLQIANEGKSNEANTSEK
uniref:NADPH:adrenodoxin oxidoreductase, mitochondrial n=1 Tax=Phallusia mammillata TaxID=59560 RepID=A0A6F9DDI9_9ASCI|nr:NADPH:adrenodoxin oxidoreductase, mitochondrial-like [Phallusia mammillata]